MRRLLAVLAVLPLLVVVSGCGSEDLPSVSVADAAQATRDAQTARMTMRIQMSGMGLPQPVTFTGEGVTALAAPRMEMTFDLGKLIGSSGAEARMLLDGARVHVQLPDIEGLELPGGAGWATVDLARAAEATGIDPAGLRELVRLTPEQQLAALEAAGDMKTVGEEEIDGVRTTHLRGTLTLRDFAATLPPERRARLDKALRRLAELSGEDLKDLDAPTPTELWVDEDAHIRRMTQSSVVPAQDGLPAGRMAITAEFSDFGTPLELDPPEGDEVWDATRALVRGIRQGSSGVGSSRERP